jgi:4'-phosphopantetheinyl transferase
MSHLVYYTRFDIPLTAQRFLYLLHKMPEPIQERILKFRRWQDAHASLLGKHLLLQAMSDIGHDIDLNDLQYTAEGRPFITGAPDFNISHSGTIVVCVLNKHGRIGIDIEERKPIDINDFTNLFSPEEWRIITQHPTETSFYEYWSIKEAILKADGVGISAFLSNLDSANKAVVTFNDQQWHILRINDFQDYACHIACNIFSNEYALSKKDFHTILMEP